MRHIESQVLHEETASEQGSVIGGHIEPVRRVMASPHAGAPNTDASPMYSFNLSFEELSTVGLDDPQRHGNMPWMVTIEHVICDVRCEGSDAEECCFLSVFRVALTEPPA